MTGTALFAWELGGGWGHLGRMAPLGDRLATRGLRIVYALQRLDRAPQAVGEAPLFQAPLLREAPAPALPMYSTADILHNAGAAEPEGVTAILRAWRSLLELVQPRVLIGDYAPFALAASRGMPMRRVVISNGFDSPPPSSPLTPFRNVPEGVQRSVTEREGRVLESFNAAIHANGGPPLVRLADLFHDVDRLALATLPELDAYPREGGEYWGTWGRLKRAAEPPRWPKGKGPRLFAYLKSFAGLEALLDKLDHAACTTVVYASADAADIHGTRRRRVRLVRSPVDLDRAAAAADAVVCHAGVGTLTRFLFAGKPAICIPLQMEQTLLARRAVALGAAVGGDAEDPGQLSAAVDRFLGGFDELEKAASSFADRYAGFDAEQQVDLLAQHITDNP